MFGKDTKTCTMKVTCANYKTLLCIEYVFTIDTFK